MNSSPIPIGRTPIRRGFTLIELLVVISVIAILAALITPAYLGVRRVAFENSIATDLSQMAAAFEKFRDEFGFYPSDFSEFVDANGDPLDFTDVIPNSGGVTVEQRLLQMLTKISPTHNENSADPIHTSETRLEHWWEEVGLVLVTDVTVGSTKEENLRGPAHAAWFWLSQLYNDAQYPISGQRDPGDPNVIVSERRVFYDFGNTLEPRLDSSGAPLFVNYPDAPVEYYLYFPVQRGGDTAIVYFHHDTYIENVNNDPSIETRINTDPSATPVTIAKPVRVPTSALADGNFIEPKSFQLIAAGWDDSFGEVNSGTYESLDNICSFSEGRLDAYVDNLSN